MTGTQDVCLEIAASMLRDLASGWPHPHVKETVEAAASLIEAVREEAKEESSGNGRKEGMPP